MRGDDSTDDDGRAWPAEPSSDDALLHEVAAAPPKAPPHASGRGALVRSRLGTGEERTMMPALIGLSFDILYAWARGDVLALQRVSTTRVAQMFASGLGLADEDVWRRAAAAWVGQEERTVKGRTDGQRGYVRFHIHADHAWVLVFDTSGRMPLLDGTMAMLDRDFESFGMVV